MESDFDNYGEVKLLKKIKMMLEDDELNENEGRRSLVEMRFSNLNEYRTTLDK